VPIAGPVGGVSFTAGEFSSEIFAGGRDLTMDWVRWHENYKASRSLKARLLVVREHLSKCFDSQPPGVIQVLSICAGDARDLIGLLATHPRKIDVKAHLIENNAELVESGRKIIVEAGFEEQLQFVVADATISSTYLGLAPVDVVLMAGVFGNLRSEEVARLIGSLGSLCKCGGYVVWTRHRRLHNGLNQIALIRQLFSESDFEEVLIEDTSDDRFTVGSHHYKGVGQVLRGGVKLFEFTGYDQI
jgi:hypothetical protein